MKLLMLLLLFLLSAVALAMENSGADVGGDVSQYIKILKQSDSYAKEVNVDSVAAQHEQHKKITFISVRSELFTMSQKLISNRVILLANSVDSADSGGRFLSNLIVI